MTLLIAGCATVKLGGPEGTSANRKIRNWEKSVQFDVKFKTVDKMRVFDGIEVTAADLPTFGGPGGVHFHGRLYEIVDGYERRCGDIFDNHSNLSSGPVLNWFDRARKGTVVYEYRFTFFRSYNLSNNYPDQYDDFEVLYTGVARKSFKKTEQGH